MAMAAFIGMVTEIVSPSMWLIVGLLAVLIAVVVVVSVFKQVLGVCVYRCTGMCIPVHLFVVNDTTTVVFIRCK